MKIDEAQIKVLEINSRGEAVFDYQGLKFTKRLTDIQKRTGRRKVKVGDNILFAVKGREFQPLM